MSRPDDNQFGRYELRINGETRGDFPCLSDVFLVLDDAFASLPDPYSGELAYRIEDFGNPDNGVPLRVISDTMAGGLWEACCENAAVFEMWLDVVGWQPTKSSS